MKVRRTIGGALFGIGCAVTFVGILATVLPMVQNDQLQLVLSSFEMPSGNLIVSAINGAMTYALHHCYGVLLCGIVMMAAGMAILLHRTRRRPVRHNTPSSYSRPASAPAPKPVWPEEDADWSAWKPRETRTNPFAGAIYEELPSRAPSPAVPSAYTPPPILPPSNAADEPSPYARPFEEAPTPPPRSESPGAAGCGASRTGSIGTVCRRNSLCSTRCVRAGSRDSTAACPETQRFFLNAACGPRSRRGRYTQPERLTCDDSFDHCFQGRKARAGTGIPSACAGIFPKGGAGWHRLRAQ